MRDIKIRHTQWAVDGEFRISRTIRTAIDVVILEIYENGHKGWAECRPYARYGHSVESVCNEIKSIKPDLTAGLTHQELQSLLPAGPARNAIDCALWDLEAKITGISVSQRLNLPTPKPRQTAFTLSLDTPPKMAQAARLSQDHSCLKIKIDADQGLDASQSILKARPDARLIIDANEALNMDQLNKLRQMRHCDRVELIEQPLPANMSPAPHFDGDMRPPICADESLHTSSDLPDLWKQGYRAVNIKLDKCGGFSEAYKMFTLAREMGFLTMAGCMVGSSLAMAPMATLMPMADIIDLDGPLLLADDCTPGLQYTAGLIYPPTQKLWG